MTTKDIRVSTADVPTACDVCGRTLLRGERAHAYLDGGTRRDVCELCTGRALQEGWVREGTVPEYDDRGSSADRRRSLLGRLRKRREAADAAPEIAEPYEPESQRRAAPAARPSPRIREPRHVRAIPTSAQQKVNYAIQAFNASEHPRTLSGVARSLGPPIVSVRPVTDRPSLVDIVAAWELCWYRYEIDLADEDHTGVRVAAQGDELSELDDDQLNANAVCDERGALVLDA
ncbi:MAG TPA: hypothetical protein VG325_04360 [Solirubrobacteraceae bacterium]|nr:hypothetical protein [Solirubrobacteraceae bacterium]